ncbi:hypothetical protein K449DRAFT_435169 [Hypoxylon sp. EC38]|nr:hypothetical protein K449DRAFT_435169 [Hypoxylon sp. EC38]
MAAYIFGTACFSRGVMGVVSPRKEYSNIGLPLESYATATSPTAHHDDPGSGFASPLMYFKGIREISYGLTLIALQRQANEVGLTTFAAILSLVRFGDGLVVWFHGGDELRYKAWGHWITGAGFLVWVVRRCYW